MLTRLFCRFDTIAKVFVDGGYTGKLIQWAEQMFGYQVEVVKRNELHQFKVLPKRWIVERTLAWLNWSRRLSKDYELRHTSAETMIYVAFAHQLLRRVDLVFRQVLRAEYRLLFARAVVPQMTV